MGVGRHFRNDFLELGIGRQAALPVFDERAAFDHRISRQHDIAHAVDGVTAINAVAQRRIGELRDQHARQRRA